MRDSPDSGSDDLGALPVDDLSTLAWVHGELRRSLDNAIRALRRCLKDTDVAAGGDIDAADPAPLRQACTQLHQGVGALELVGLPALARVLRAAESAVQRLLAKPAQVDAKAVDVIERVAFGLLDYLARMLARKAVSPLMLFPQYRDALQLAGADRIHPADLWQPDWQWRELPQDAAAQPRDADDATRGLLEAEVLALMRDPGPAAARISDLCADLAAGARGLGRLHQGTLWQLAAAVFEAQAVGLLQSDVYSKRLASRLLTLLRASARGGAEDTAPSDRLAQDLLFFCARASEPEAGSSLRITPRLAAVRQAWRLGGSDAEVSLDYEQSRLGRLDPALLVQARKRVAAAKDAWSALAGGELHRLQPLADQMHLVGESMQKLFPEGEVLAQALEATAAQVAAAGEPPPAALAMEVATSLLFLDASLEDGELDRPDLPKRLVHLAGRIDAVRGGAEPQPLEIWMEELYRRVSDRQTMGNVVAELRATLSEVEKQIDQYFRNPADRHVLIPVPAQLGAMRGVLSVLGMDQASQAALHLRDKVDELAQTEVDVQRATQAGTFDHLADNLGTLGFLIDMLSVQPQLARNLFRFDPDSGSLIAVMGRTERTPASVARNEPAAPPAPVPPSGLAPAEGSGHEDDAALREVFVEEAREVLAEAQAALGRLAGAPENLPDITTLRRAFHTLKGSSRMTGLKDFGEAAWSCEQLFNARLATDPHTDAPLRELSAELLAYLGAWVEAIASGRPGGHDSVAVSRAADALRLEGRLVPVQPVQPVDAPAAEPLDDGFDLHFVDAESATPTPAAALVARVPDLPSADELDFMLDGPASPVDAVDEGRFGVAADALVELPLDAPEPAGAATPVLPNGGVEVLEIDLAALDGFELQPPVPDAGIARDDEEVKHIGALRIPIQLFNIYLNEADELSRRLVNELAEWSLEAQACPVPEVAVALAHSLAGSSATVGYAELSELARAFEHALMRSAADGRGRAGEPELFNAVAEEIRRLLHQFAAGFLRPVHPVLTETLTAHERLPPPRDDALAETATHAQAAPPPQPDPATGAAAPEAVTEPADIAVQDAVDAELFPIFEEEADELLPQLRQRLRDWHAHPGSPSAPAACMRTLHTFKGGARLAGALRLGEMAHRLESEVEALMAQAEVAPAQIDPLLVLTEAMSTVYERMRRRGARPVAAGPAVALAPQTVPSPEAAIAEQPAGPDNGAPVAIDWGRFVTAPAPALAAAAEEARATAAVRVRASLLDRLVNHAGELAIARSRLEGGVKQLQASMGELGESLGRMRRQLRDIELQADTQIAARVEAARSSSEGFDPLEMDRYTRSQELTRFMAESVNDVATLQRSLQRTLQMAEDELAAQARLTRELQDDLLRTRMVQFESTADRLYRCVRQAARETAKQVRLDIVGGGIEIDRGVLERMVGSFEHLLRNSVAHGIEAPAERTARGKDVAGQITVTVAHSGNELAVEFADDGAGLDLSRIRLRGIERGLIAADAVVSEKELAGLIFAPAFSTAETVTEIAGRGVGLDVVRAEVAAIGGRVEIASEPGRGARFRLLLPLTTAVTQVVMLRAGSTTVAVPSPLIEHVRRAPTAEVEAAYAGGTLAYQGEALPFFWLEALLQAGRRGVSDGRTQSVVIVRSAAQRVAVHVDEVLGIQEVVVKNVGRQLSRLPGLAGVTLLPSGALTLIYNPVALAAVYAEPVQAAARAAATAAVAPHGAPSDTPAAVARAPLVLVVDDSLTVRRITQRLLLREGYRVDTAKDGLEALERLARERPAVLLSDIEMPRMDGFDLVRNVRADPGLSGLPVIMISSRIAQKHRDHAAELGVDHYLGKPYAEDELLGLIAGHLARAAAQPA